MSRKPAPPLKGLSAGSRLLSADALRSYRAVFKLRLLLGLQYRTAAWAGIATQFFWGFMLLMVYEAFYRSSASAPPIPWESLVSYIWLQQSFLAFVMLYFRDNEIFELITSGNIAYELCRPTDIYGFWYAKLIAQRLSSALLRSLPILIAAYLLPETFRLHPPASATAALLFAITLLLGLLVLVALSMLIYISVFYTLSPMGSLVIFATFGEFLAGMIVPVPFMPDWLQRVVYLLPFRYASDLPFRIYSGQIPPGRALLEMGLQGLWVTMLIFFGYRWLRSALRRVVIQGG